MYQYDEYINLNNSEELPEDLRGKCVRVVSVSDNFEDIVVFHKYKTYTVNERHIINPEKKENK